MCPKGERLRTLFWEHTKITPFGVVEGQDQRRLLEEISVVGEVGKELAMPRGGAGSRSQQMDVSEISQNGQ